MTSEYHSIHLSLVELIIMKFFYLLGQECLLQLEGHLRISLSILICLQWFDWHLLIVLRQSQFFHLYLLVKP